MNRFFLILSISLWMAATSFTSFALQPTPATVELPGLRADGSVLLPNQWSLRPAGKQVPLGDFPVNIAIHPDGRFAAVLHSGHGPHEIIVVDVQTARVVSRAQIKEAFYGLEFSHGGNRLYCSGSSDEVVHVFDFKDGNLTENGDIRLCNASERGIPCGMAVAGNARDLYVANVWGQYVSKVDLSRRATVQEIIPVPGATNEVTRMTEIEKQDPDPDLEAITKRAAAQFDTTKPDAPFPYACRLDERRQVLYVSLWAKAAVAVIDLKSNQTVACCGRRRNIPTRWLLTKSGRYPVRRECQSQHGDGD